MFLFCLFRSYYCLRLYVWCVCMSVCVRAACHNCHNFYLVTAAVAMATKAALLQTTFVCCVVSFCYCCLAYLVVVVVTMTFGGLHLLCFVVVFCCWWWRWRVDSKLGMTLRVKIILLDTWTSGHGVPCFPVSAVPPPGAGSGSLFPGN